MTSLSASPFLTDALMRQGVELRGAVETRARELTTGIVADPGRHLRGDFSALAGIDHALARIRAHQSAVTDTGILADTAQAALATLSDGVDRLAMALLGGSGMTGAGGATTLVRGATDNFRSAVEALNTRVAGRSVFGGTGNGLPPLPKAETILDALQGAVTGAATASDAAAAITAWFDSPDGFSALYRGGPPRVPVPLADGETASMEITALDPAIRRSLAGLATAALLERGLLAGDESSRVTLARLAGEQLMEGREGLTALQAEVGFLQSRVADAAVRNGAEKSALDIARLSLIEADPYESATRLRDLQNRLDAFYTVTGRLAGLSLTGYLR